MQKVLKNASPRARARARIRNFFFSHFLHTFCLLLNLFWTFPLKSIGFLRFGLIFPWFFNDFASFFAYFLVSLQGLCPKATCCKSDLWVFPSKRGVFQSPWKPHHRQNPTFTLDRHFRKTGLIGISLFSGRWPSTPVSRPKDKRLATKWVDVPNSSNVLLDVCERGELFSIIPTTFMFWVSFSSSLRMPQQNSTKMDFPSGLCHRNRPLLL